MSAYQANVASSTIQGNIARAPQPPCSRMGGLFNEQPAAAGCDGRSPHGLQSVASSEAGSRGAAPLPLG